MCVASLALPPLPNSSTLWPVRSAFVITAAASPIAASGSSASSVSCAAMLSRISSAASLLISPPRAQTRRLERKLLDARAELSHAACDVVLAVVAAVEDHVAPTARADHLASDRAHRERSVVQLLDPVVRDAIGHPLLRLPRVVQQRSEVVKPPLQELVIHLVS